MSDNNPNTGIVCQESLNTLKNTLSSGAQCQVNIYQGGHSGLLGTLPYNHRYGKPPVLGSILTALFGYMSTNLCARANNSVNN